MKKNYFYLLFFLVVLALPLKGFSQDNSTIYLSTPRIEGLSIYPNPVTDGKGRIYITSAKRHTKTVRIYNVLGKQVLVATLIGKELDISRLNKGVYILKITENNISETRKLIIK